MFLDIKERVKKIIESTLRTDFLQSSVKVSKHSATFQFESDNAKSSFFLRVICICTSFLPM